MELTEIMLECQHRKASDIHLVQDEPPVLRISGRLHRLSMPKLSAKHLESMILGMLTDDQRETFLRESDVNFAFALPEYDRYRVNVHRDRGAIEAAMRRLPSAVPSLPELGVPAVAADLARKPNGIVLVTGPAGVGKTTTLAAMVNLINGEHEYMIVMIEDPIEYVHENKRSFVKQREVTKDTPSFAKGLRNALRQDPDVIVVGEMLDLETISIALTAAETGHLVLTTLHTSDAPQTVARIIDVFPEHQQTQVRAQLADCLQGIISQLLLPKLSGHGVVLATEVLIATPAVRNIIRENQVEQLPTVIQTGTKDGMHSMEHSLAELVRQRSISYETALARVRYPADFAAAMAMTVDRVVAHKQHRS